MKKSILVSLTAAVLSVASPLALAHTFPVESTQTGYLASRANMDSPEAVSQALERIQTQQQRAATLEAGEETHLALAGRENVSTLDDVNAIYQRVDANRAKVNVVASERHDYLAERMNMDSPEHISQTLSRIFSTLDADRISQR